MRPFISSVLPCLEAHVNISYSPLRLGDILCNQIRMRDPFLFHPSAIDLMYFVLSPLQERFVELQLVRHTSQGSIG